MNLGSGIPATVEKNRLGGAAGQWALPQSALRVATDAPGAVVEVVEIVDGVQLELNGVGSVVGHIYPWGIDEIEETLAQRIKRLEAELKSAKAEFERRRPR